MILGIIIGLSLILIVFFYIRGLTKGIKSGIDQAASSVASVFDQANPKGWDIFHNFLEGNFLKYLHKRMVGYESGSMPITNFIEEMTDASKISTFVTGFTILIQSQISDELKKIFFRYYNYEERDAGGKTKKDTYQTNIFDKYLIEWATLRIRKITAEFVTSLGNANLSQAHAIKINAQMFTMLEVKVYTYLGMLDTDVSVSKTSVR